MITELIIEEFDLAFIDEDQSRPQFDALIKNAMGMIENARELISDDELMYLIINPIANTIANTIAIMFDDDDHETIDRVTDQIATMIMDSFAD